MRYLYTGQFEPSSEFLQNIEIMVDILRVADEEFLDEVSKFTLLFCPFCSKLDLREILSFKWSTIDFNSKALFSMLANLG